MKAKKFNSIAACHMTMRHTHTDGVNGEKSFHNYYGPSTSKCCYTVLLQNIWAQLRKSWSNWWINLLRRYYYSQSSTRNYFHRYQVLIKHFSILTAQATIFEARFYLYTQSTNTLGHNELRSSKRIIKLSYLTTWYSTSII